ncbi:hypothetical protein QUF75_06850 [Desulfococcaceae bacterium HSG7]|nr:hypothetical protein [Desulfococcaceae bacterium HSG7]
MTQNLHRSIPLHAIILITFLIISCIFMGCDTTTSSEDDEDYATVYIYNYDEEFGYLIDLYLVSEDSVIDSRTVGPYPDDDYADSFEGLEPDQYYFVIYKDQGSVESGRSQTFILEEPEERYFYIEESEVKDME